MGNRLTGWSKLKHDLQSVKLWVFFISCYFFQIGRLESLHWTMLTCALAGIKAYDGYRFARFQSPNIYP